MNKKALLLFVLFLLMFVIFAVRLFYIQVIDDSYKLNAESNAIRKEYVYAARGFCVRQKQQTLGNQCGCL